MQNNTSKFIKRTYYFWYVKLDKIWKIMQNNIKNTCKKVNLEYREPQHKTTRLLTWLSLYVIQNR